jgi:TonB family protein
MRGQLLRMRKMPSRARVPYAGFFAMLCALGFFPGAAAAQSSGSVRGIVRDSLGGVVADAHVMIGAAQDRTVTDSAGVFRFPRVPSGDEIVNVRRLGFRPISDTVKVVQGRESELEFRLAPVAEQLAPVEIRQRREIYDSRLAGFNARKDKHVGHIVTRDQLDRMSSGRFIDALRDMPGVQMRTLRGGVETVQLRGARCSPMFYMDGFPATSGVMDLGMIDLSGVEGIEVYSGLSSIPAEFMSVRGAETCGVIAVWSRPFRPKPRRANPLSPAELERLVTQGTVYTADQVDEPASLLAGSNALPVYPDSLWAAGVSGRVVAQFVVDEKGQIEPGTLTIASATHPYFASAVRYALEGAVFSAAKRAGQAVRQLVELPFHFQRAGPGQDSVPVTVR